MTTLGLTVLLLAAPPTPARAPRLSHPQAQAHLTKALAAYRARDYQTAVVELEAAYALDANDDVLFAWAQAERLSGDCPSAVVLYRRFLETDAPASEAEQARDHLRRCQRALASQPGLDASSDTLDTGSDTLGPRLDPGAAPPAAVGPLSAPGVAAAVPWYRDVVGHVLWTLGALVTATGVGLWVDGSAAAAALPRSPTYDAFAAEVDRSRGERIGGVASMIAGGVLIGAGVLRFVVAGGTPVEEQDQVAGRPRVGP